MAEDNGTGTESTEVTTTLQLDGEAIAESVTKSQQARTFSQEDLDRIVKDRLARQKTQFADYDELKAKADKLAEIEAANLSELEKAQKAAADAAAERDKILAEAQETRLYAALLAEAAKVDRKVVDPEAAVRLLDRSTLELGEDGVPTNVAEAMDALLEARPFLVVSGGSGTRGSADQGARKTDGPAQLSKDDLKGMKPEDIVKARREGRLLGVVSGTQ